MRGLVAALGALLVGGVAVLAGPGSVHAKEVKEFEIGQWAGFVWNDDKTGQFVDCTAWAYNDHNIQLGISVNKTWNLSLWLNSDAWDLPGNQSYPISYWIDRNALYHGKAVTDSAKFVKIEVDRGQAVFDELRGGSQLTFRTQSDDYVFNLRNSNAALNRLLDCVDRYSKQASTNPFGNGSGDPSSDSGQNTQPFGDQQQQDGGPSSSDDAQLTTLTRSIDEVRQFLVDVTGAKPSMITIEPQKFKSGAPYYYFSTPIGAGQFWQEYIGNDNLRDVVVSYLNGYKDECKGEFEQSVADLVQGGRGQSILGVASCSSSEYQDGGPEVLSYAITASDDVFSIYATYVGGNAAKAKTDSLGKLIARRQESDVR